ncbi:MAG: type II toxin-antitoxin system Phd/YefM family antitoxin [Beijerinckiaceae bacterium]
MAATFTCSAFRAQVGEALDRALSQPVIVTKHGKPKNVVLSYDAYERLIARHRRIIRPADWSEEESRALDGMAMEPGHEAFNVEFNA